MSTSNKRTSISGTIGPLADFSRKASGRLDLALLGNKGQIAALEKLPKQFAFKEAKQVYDRADDPTRKFLVKCIQAGLIRQTGRGLYERLG